MLFKLPTQIRTQVQTRAWTQVLFLRRRNAPSVYSPTRVIHTSSPLLAQYWEINKGFDPETRKWPESRKEKEHWRIKIDKKMRRKRRNLKENLKDTAGMEKKESQGSRKAEEEDFF